MNDRIKLAEAMGWERYAPRFRFETGKRPLWIKGDEQRKASELPDPFTDAIDDYAVLEWMRGDEDAMETPRWRAFKDYFIEVTADWNIWNYKIGDFARAALKVIDHE